MRLALCLPLLVSIACASTTPTAVAPSPQLPADSEAAPPGEKHAVAEAKAPAASEPIEAHATSAPAPAEPPPPLPKDTVVLHVGDSMADALGKSLNRELKQRGIKSYLEAKEATYIPQWAGYKMELAQHIIRRNPDLVIITLGGNETRMPDPSVRADAIKRLVKKIGDRPCLWIAAPLWPGLKSTGILEVIRDNCAPCRYVDTNAMISEMERTSDGVHPTIPERRRWAAFMIRWMLQNRKPDGKRPWDFKQQLAPPPDGSESWLSER
jgi:hypothetical protein